VTYPHSLNVEAMTEAAQPLLGLRDFVAFCKPKDTGTSIRTLMELSPQRNPNGMIEITVTADAFCHSMVRCLVGGLVGVGRGLRDVTWITTHLNSGRRANDVVVMPAHGLTLEEVTYPPSEHLEERANQAKARRDESPQS
jgi:tRNA pseudouridine38-40 synthase